MRIGSPTISRTGFPVARRELDERDISVQLDAMNDEEEGRQSDEDDKVRNKISCGLTYYATTQF